MSVDVGTRPDEQQTTVLPTADDGAFIRVGPLDEVRRRGVMVVRGADRPIAVFAHDEGKVSAVDNRCPHLGFPLSRGTVRDGILVCHWHQARFDLCSGCTFDLFADDVPAYEVKVRADGDVYVAALPRQNNDAERYRRRLREGMEQNIGLIQAKGVIGLLRSAGADRGELVGQIALFGAHNRDGWGGGMTGLVALANLAPLLGEETAYLALYQGAIRVARDCAGQSPRRERHPLGASDIPLETLKRWLLHWTTVRHRDAAERTLLTALHGGATPAQVCDLLFAAATERFYADGGHVLDFCNKAVELLEMIGWEHAADILPTVLGQLVAARGGEEMSHWRSPVDLVPPLERIAALLPDLLREGEGKSWDDVRGLSDALLGEDPLAILEALRSAFLAGARPEQAARALTYAAALRVARFGTANEIGDWITVLHTFTYCNALHQAVRRCPTSPELARGIFHGAVSVYFDRFLNVPPARLPGESRDGSWDAEEPDDAQALLDGFLEALNGQQKVPAAARAVAHYLRLGHPTPPLLDALALAAVREDADFHTLQMVEGGIRQWREWEGQPEADHFLIAVARYLAAHSPTQRAQLQTARIALRLHRGDTLYGDDAVDTENSETDDEAAELTPPSG